MPQLNILAVDDDSVTLEHLEFVLKDYYNVYKAKTVDQALEIMRRSEIHIVLLDVDFGSGAQDGISGLQAIKKIDDKINVVMLTATKTMDVVKQAIALGATDYIRKPIDEDDLLFTLGKLEIKRKLEKENLVLKTRLDRYEGNVEIIGKSPAVRSMLERVDRLRDHNANVLITGESGTGKELVARRLHAHKNGSPRPFVPVNCAAIPSNLLESILFGYEKSSYTGATKSSPGKFELADGGDIFLDEISCLDIELQAKLLRVLQEREVERIGALRPKNINFRVISASNKDLLQLVKEKKFREDLYYRINSVEIKVPPLRERKGDIPILVDHFIGPVKKLGPGTMEMLVKYEWPGNIRQLEHVITNAIIFSKGETIYPYDIPPQLGGESDNVSASPATLDFNGSLDKMLKDFEKRLIDEAVKRTPSAREAAKLLKVKPTTFYSKLAKYKCQKEAKQ